MSIDGDIRIFHVVATEGDPAVDPTISKILKVVLADMRRIEEKLRSI